LPIIATKGKSCRSEGSAADKDSIKKGGSIAIPYCLFGDRGGVTEEEKPAAHESKDSEGPGLDRAIIYTNGTFKYIQLERNRYVSGKKDHHPGVLRFGEGVKESTGERRKGAKRKPRPDKE